MWQQVGGKLCWWTARGTGKDQISRSEAEDAGLIGPFLRILPEEPEAALVGSNAN